MKNNLLKVLALSVISVSSIAGLASCSGGDSYAFTAGLITIEDENSTYDKNFIDSFKAACNAKNVKALVKTNVPEDATCTTAADDFVDQGCKFVFADSFSHESFLIESAKKATNVQFAHATGYQAKTSGLSNFSNAFASIYEGRYLAGVAAGLKLQSMIEADPSTSKVIGYVGAKEYAEVISGYTAWYLGVKSIVPSVTMKVKFTGSWYDETAEGNAAKALIAAGCTIISQHADSWGAPKACEKESVPNVSYNGSTASQCPNTYLVSSKINWQPYFEYCLDQVKAGKAIKTDYVAGLGSTLYNGSVALTDLGTAAVSGTEDRLNTEAAKLRNGSLKVFDCDSFTVNGERLTSYEVDFGNGKQNVISTTTDGKKYFDESNADKFHSAPYFDISIDGIEKI